MDKIQCGYSLTHNIYIMLDFVCSAQNTQVKNQLTLHSGKDIIPNFP